MVKYKETMATNSGSLLREQILLSMIASFKIEGINISSENAIKALRKVELSLEKRKQ